MNIKVDCIKDKKKVGVMKLKSEFQNSAKLYFYGDICSEKWQSALYEDDKCPQDVVDFLSAIDSFENLDIYINSGGGSAFAGMAIYNNLKRHKGTKTVHIDGCAASIASVIALAGDEVICPENSQIMIHKPFADFEGNADEFRRFADRLDAVQENILSVYMQHTKEGVTEEQVNQMINDETWFTGSKAAEIFNITVTDTVEIAACADSTYFEKYKNAPDSVKNQRVDDDTKNEVDRLRLELEIICL